VSAQGIAVPASCVVPRRVETAREEAAKRLEAELVGVLHNELHGVASALCGRRSPAYRRQQLRGEHPFTFGDLADLMKNPSLEARRAVRALIAFMAEEIRPHEGIEALEDATAAFVREAADVPATVLSAQRDGRLTEDEVEDIAREVNEAGACLDRVRAALPEVRS